MAIQQLQSAKKGLILRII